MKISNYNQLLAISTLLSALIMFATLWSQYQKVEKTSRAHFESRLLVLTVEHLSTQSQIWLTTQDLLFSGNQTYLANGINAQSKLLIKTLLIIKDKENTASISALVQQLTKTISDNETIINSFSRLPTQEQKNWQTIIAQSDELTTRYVQLLATLLTNVSQRDGLISTKLSNENAQLIQTTWVMISLYLVFILIVVTWFSKYIVKPIENITAIAQQPHDQEQKIEFRQKTAPTEVIALSAAIQSFTQRITIEKSNAERERVKVFSVYKQLSTIMNSIPCSILLLSDKGLITECNPEACRLFLSSKKNVVNKNIATFIPALATLDNEFDTDIALKNMEESLLAPHFEHPHIEFSGRKITIKGTVSYLLTISDINERKNNQKALTALNQQLISAEKLASIGQLSAGIAHEINNPVGFIHSNLHVLNDYITSLVSYIKLVNNSAQSANASVLYENEDLDYIIGDIAPLITSSLEGTSRVSQIIKDLGNYAHVNNKKPEQICIDELLEQSLTLVANELKYKVDIVKDLNAKVEVTGFPQKLLQVFINMLVNASHAIVKTGQIKINSRIENDEVIISFRDNGIGIHQTHLKNLFDPFFTTKPVGKGTGLGLHIVRSIIDEHNGRIEVSSIIGQGSKFTIYLPAPETISC